MEPLIFGETIRAPDVRNLYDMKEVIADQDWLQITDNFDLYYMYRELARDEEDLRLMREFGLRYDITVIPPARLGNEYIKTAGHYHPRAPRAEVSYPEVYQVLEGEAVYLLQRVEGSKVLDVVVIEAEKGDVVLVPPDYGHITINRAETTLKMANWVCSRFSSIYEPIRKFGGGAYYLLEEGFMVNPCYSEVPEIRELSPADLSKYGIFEGEDIYELVNEIEKLGFLKEPQDFPDVFMKFRVV
ncbi:glucose-6-phosphate isomerase [Methanosarcina sp. 1.H.T.1A.1]|uniref:glucose-6-phosphate isomerase family protein n=1 Tax=Methanosarcina sp. 1.H.T.1A.1 TaxID=1483602 RepID=UPI00062189BA|nr:glucose-6-phosphate isomerase family protein [Methanosarcina sp. 1.H.T.1A.1]KKH94292.1 glucose-6-phosphate isomerase [Methanosarcina sp. 1.H.T.1A.1]